MLRNSCQCGGLVGINIAGNPQLSARFHLGKQQGQGVDTHEPTLLVSLLWPGVGIEQKHLIQAAIGQPCQNLTGIALMDPQAVTAIMVLRIIKKLRHAVDEWLAADETGRWLLIDLVKKVLTSAKADLHGKALNGADEQRQRLTAGLGKVKAMAFQPRQVGLLTVAAQGLALAPPVEKPAGPLNLLGF